MARAPIPGEAKTRLIPALGSEGAATLHAWLVEHLLGKLSGAAVAPITLLCTPVVEHPFFRHCQQRYGVRLEMQQGSDLGERLSYALQTSLLKHEYAVVVGCDIPQLDGLSVAAALESLEEGVDAAITPTEDGGYALLALRRTQPVLFDGIAWGSGEVMAQTRQRLTSLDWQWQELERLWDVDIPEDLVRLAGLPLPEPVMERIIGLTEQGNGEGIHQQQQR